MAIKINQSDALIVVDVQNDFCSGGTLAVKDGDQVVDVFNRIIDRFRVRVLTRDWHPPNHVSFAARPQFVDKSWPAHCVAGTPGADFHPRLITPADAIIVSKATDPDRESYSDFQGTDLANTLRARKVNRVFVGGLATDYCVKATVLDAIAEGFAVVLLLDASRGVDIPAGTAALAVETMKAAGAVVARSTELL